MSNPRKSASSPLIHPRPTPFGPPPPYTSTPLDSSENDDEDAQRPIYTSWVNHRNPATTPAGLRSRFLNGLMPGNNPRPKVKTISTTPGQLCLGETETEADEPVSNVHYILTLRNP